MGSCFGRCLPARKNSRHGVENNIYFNTESVEAPVKKYYKPRGITSFLSLRQNKSNGEEVTLELEEDDWTRSDLRSKHLKFCTTKMGVHGTNTLNTCPLNVYALEELQDVTSPSTPHSSIDLEWEPEGLILPEVPARLATIEDKELDYPVSAVCTSSQSAPWSRMSSPNSLEWDPCEEDGGVVGDSSVIYGEDAETEQLISEIEQLTSRALRETGSGWNGCLR
ncbi:uncharacterized protein LOC124160696 isoform X2 [Ischnura elegans]|uniref:uncharacterized protein LOC124160696 isoform X2 n=1 Tax=Ischnura elegans TaxID=197161 RepID=UPI001ED8BD59|nr:uncharacterized protein LOC124160696 isoform X2 [Ischnura elegans]